MGYTELLGRLTFHRAPNRAAPARIVRPAAPGDTRSFERHLFVCGLHRSGTTLLESMLQAACEVAVLRAEVPENEGQHLQDVLPTGWDHGGPGRFAFAPEMHPAPPAPDAAAAARARLLACWSPFVEGEAPMLLEKSPPNLTRIDWLRAVFPGARFAIITRDPRVVAAATQKWSGTSIPEMMFHWHVAHDAAFRAMGPDCCHVRYEDLCAAPEAVLDRLIDTLDLPRPAIRQPLPERFAEIRSSNASYLDRIPPRRYGRGAWTEAGYDLEA